MYRENFFNFSKYAFLSLLMLLTANLFADGHSQEVDLNVQSALGSKANPIRVGVIEVSPFGVLKEGVWTGLTIEYWEKIANEYGWQFTYESAGESYSGAAVDLSRGKYDLILGNFSTFYERGKIVDFSRPFLLNYVSVLTSTTKTQNIFLTILSVIQRLVLPILGVIAVVFVIFTVVLSRNKELTSEKSYATNTFYVLMAMLQGQVSFVNKPHCLASRLALVILAFFSVFFVATFSAVMTDTLIILDDPVDPFTKLKDVQGKRFILEEGSGFVPIVQELGGITTEIKGLEGASNYYYVHRDRYDGFVADHALVHMLDKSMPTHDIIQSQINLRNDELVFLLNKKFPLTKQVNLAILKFQDDNSSVMICAKYLGIDSKLCVL